jgi:hypothetical protein
VFNHSDFEQIVNIDGKKSKVLWPLKARFSHWPPKRKLFISSNPFTLPQHDGGWIGVWLVADNDPHGLRIKQEPGGWKAPVLIRLSVRTNSGAHVKYLGRATLAAHDLAKQQNANPQPPGTLPPTI